MDSIQLDAYAKVNFGLDVTGRRPDGYHEVKMVMQTVDIKDTLYLEKREAGIFFETKSREVPADADNLVVKAARLMAETCGLTEGVFIRLSKRIPVAAGMAGGSTDAAAVLKGMNLLFETGLSERELCRLGMKIGADVPYCVMGGTALAEGIGEKLTRLPPAPDCTLLVAKPDICVSTKYVYENLHWETIKEHPDIDGMVQAIRKGSLEGITERMDNVLQRVTEREYPVIARLKQFMEQQGAMKALMSGSGPTVYGIFADKGEAEKAAKALTWPEVKQIFVTGLWEGL